MFISCSLNGVLLNKEDCKNVRVISEINDDVEYFHASLQVSPVKNVFDKYILTVLRSTATFFALLLEII